MRIYNFPLKWMDERKPQQDVESRTTLWVQTIAQKSPSNISYQFKNMQQVLNEDKSENHKLRFKCGNRLRKSSCSSAKVLNLRIFKHCKAEAGGTRLSE